MECVVSEVGNRVCVCVTAEVEEVGEGYKGRGSTVYPMECVVTEVGTRVCV